MIYHYHLFSQKVVSVMCWLELDASIISVEIGRSWVAANSVEIIIAQKFFRTILASICSRCKTHFP